MNNGTMFGPLMDFQDNDYLKKHTTITFDTMYRPGTYKILPLFNLRLMTRIQKNSNIMIYQRRDFL